MVDDMVMKGIPQIVTTVTPSMPIVNGEIGTFDALLCYVQDYTHSILVIVSGDSLVSIGCV